VRAEPELRHVGLADGQRAGPPDALHGHRVEGRHLVAVDPRAARGDEPPGILQILEGDWQAVQRPQRVAGRLARVGRVSQGQAGLVGQLGHDGVDLGVQAGNLGQVGLHHLARRHLAAGDQTGERPGARETQRRRHQAVPQSSVRHRLGYPSLGEGQKP